MLPSAQQLSTMPDFTTASAINLLPKPAELIFQGKWFGCSKLPRVVFGVVDTVKLQNAASRLLNKMHKISGQTDVASATNAPDQQTDTTWQLHILCATTSEPWPALGDDESYRLSIDDNRINIQATTEWGVLHALETLAQLIKADGCGGWQLPILTIADKPAYAWRGFCLDLCRHWFGIDSIKRVLDGMAATHLNVLHLHLSDDQAFRLALNEVPMTSHEDPVGRLSQDDVNALASYAAHRAIRLVPEIDVPGHTTALLAACPELAIGPAPAAPSAEFGGHTGCVHPGQEVSYSKLARILAEVASWFPDHYLHTGGDEVNFADHLNNPSIRQFMATSKLADGPAVQAHFNLRLHAIVTALGKNMVVWDEALHPSLPKEVVVQCWRGVGVRNLAVTAGHRVLFSGSYYLDLNYSASTHYRFDPAASDAELQQAETDSLQAAGMEGLEKIISSYLSAIGFPAQQHTMPAPAREQILGGEACMWSELVDDQCLDTRVFSRLPAIAERFWLGQQADNNDNDLYRRLQSCWHYLERTTALRPLSSVSARLHELDGRPEVALALITLVACLEPVKWYCRVLGEAHLQARIDNIKIDNPRPYTATTPLNRIVDICPPESMLAQQLTQIADSLEQPSFDASRLHQLALDWQQQITILRQSSVAVIEEVLPLSEKLGRLGLLMTKLLKQQPLSAIDKQSWQTELQQTTATADLTLAVIIPLRDIFLALQSQATKADHCR